MELCAMKIAFRAFETRNNKRATGEWRILRYSLENIERLSNSAQGRPLSNIVIPGSNLEVRLATAKTQHACRSLRQRSPSRQRESGAKVRP